MTALPLSPTLNQFILARAQSIPYRVSDHAPATYPDLVSCYSSSGLVIYAGASERTIYADPSVNWAFRAWHDWTHLTYGLPFTTAGELQACAYQLEEGEHLSPYDRSLIYADIAGQVSYFARHNSFPLDQVEFVSAFSSLPSRAFPRP